MSLRGLRSLVLAIGGCCVFWFALAVLVLALAGCGYGGGSYGGYDPGSVVVVHHYHSSTVHVVHHYVARRVGRR